MTRKAPDARRTAATLATLTLLALIASPVPAAAAQDQRWITQFGTSESDVAWALAPDGAGGVMIAGHTNGSLGGPGAGYGGIFLARYDGDGNRLWIRRFGTGATGNALALAPDGTGGVMVAGWTFGSLGGPNAGGTDVFLARYDETGNRLWIRQFGTSRSEEAFALAPDGAGGVIVTGHTFGSLGGASAGGTDAFLARYDADGNQRWIRQFGTSRCDFSYALASDGAGGVFVSGMTVDGLVQPCGGFTDAFLARFDSAGNQLWIHQFGTGERVACALAPDSAGGVFVAGSTSGSPGWPSVGSGDAFLARYDDAGNRLWIRQFGSTWRDDARALAPDGAGGVIVAGWTEGSLGGPNAGWDDVFLARYDESGTQLWIRQFGTISFDYSTGAASDGVGGVMVTGYTHGSLGGPHAGPSWTSDVFLARYSIDSCYADCDQSTGNGVLDIFDFLCFQNDFVTGNSYACDCDTSTGPLVCDMLDFLCFQNAFVAGCP